MKRTLFEGSGVAIVTPFKEKGVDFAKLEELIEFQIENKTDALIICGTTGEASTMPDSEHMSCIKFAVDTVKGRIPVIAGTGSNDTYHGAELSKEAESLGVDGLLLVTPYYNKTSSHGLVRHYEDLCKDLNTPVIVYNVPSRTGVNITPDALLKISEIDNVVAIKEASGNISQVVKMASLVGNKIDIYSGNDDMIVPLLSVGGKGVISVVANILPKKTHDIVRFYLDGNIDKSKKLQLEMLELINALFIEVNPVPIKTAMNLAGMGVGMLRPPLYDMSPKNKEVLISAMRNYGFNIKENI